MILLPPSVFLFFALLPAALAHSNPKTDAQIEVQRSLQQAAYHCAPAVAQFTTQRKRAWAQKVLAGNPSLPAYQDLFTSYNDAIDEEKALPGEEGQELMSCTPVTEEAKIENNSCVLSKSNIFLISLSPDPWIR